jgi:aspartate aminotransferase
VTPDPSFAPSANIAQMQESATIAVSQRAKALRAQGRTILDVGAGEPDFDTPEPIRRAAQQAIDAGATRYTPTEGTIELRSAIAARATARRGRGETLAPNEVVVSTGSKQSIFNACFSLFGPGDEVLIPSPAWTSYYEIVSLARAKPVAVMGDPAHGFRVTPAMLDACATPRTRGVILNSPVNPTGTVYSADELRALLELADTRGWWMISDEIYLRIAYEREAPSCLDVAPSRERLIVVEGVAKAFAMTGWRIGWTLSSAALAKAMAAFQSHTTFNASAVSQAASVAALTLGAPVDRAVAGMVAEFRRRRDAALAIFARAPHIRVNPPEGAFYLFIEAPGAGKGDAAGTRFAAHLLDEQGVAVVPGAAFHAPDWIRMSYATALEHVEAAAQKIVVAWGEG